MGNNSSRSSTYEKYYKSIENNTDDIDPYEVFGLSKNFEWDELKMAYRRVAKLVHPDKGGNEILFNKVTECFRKLAQEYKSRQADRPFYELRNESKQYYQDNPLKTMPPEIYKKETGENFVDRFNRTFEQNRLEDDGYGDNVGYGDMMEKSSKNRDDIEIPKVLNSFNNDKFNKKFDEITLSTPMPKTKEIAKYQEPQALPLAIKLNYTELGGQRPDDFSSTNEGEQKSLQYTDYKKAYTTTRLVDPRLVEQRKSYKSVDDYEKSRDKALKKGLSEKELRQYEDKKRKEELAEEERKRRLIEKDKKISQHHEYVNRLLIQK